MKPTESTKQVTTWHSPRVEQPIRLVRWGFWGRPVLLFPTAGGDAEECERFLMIRALAPLLDAGRIKVYSLDSVAGRAWVEKKPAAYCARLQNAFDAAIHREVVPAIRADCKAPDLGVITAGASIGAYNAVTSLVRHPDVFTHAIGMSGTYDLSKWLDGPWPDGFYFTSPIHFLPGLGEGPLLATLRTRFILLPTGEGPWEDPSSSWEMAHALGSKGVPNRVDLWGRDYDHDWPTWRTMLPKYLDDLVD
jgi:esterase/lipase superfamily enzyme